MFVFLDDAIQAVSKLKEPLELNFVRKHALENQQSQPRILAGMMRPHAYLEHSRELTVRESIYWSTLRHGKIKMTFLICL